MRNLRSNTEWSITVPQYLLLSNSGIILYKSWTWTLILGHFATVLLKVIEILEKRRNQKKLYNNNNITEYILKKIHRQKSLPDMTANKTIIWLCIFGWIQIKSSNLFHSSVLPAQLIPQGKQRYIYTGFMITGKRVIAFLKYLHK